LDNDIYSVGRTVNNEYTDYLLLNNNVVPKDGVYSFEIREIPSEESSTDMVKLITIDHPAGTRAGVDSSGSVHSYANPAAADSAYDNSGSDVLSSISSRDGNGAAIYHNSSVVLDFSSVDITTAAKLVISVDGFEGKLLGIPTYQVPAIQIQTLQGGLWVTRHSFFPKELRAEGVFDLKPYLDESKTVRLLSISCDPGKYHMLDYAALDNSIDTFSASVLDPLTAVLNGSIDVLSDISNSDNVYANLKGNDIIVMTFPFTSPVYEQRSFVLISEGYYTPGKGNTYYVDTWNGSAWVERGILYDPMNSSPAPDVVVTADLSAYLPDPAGEYKVHIRNSMIDMQPHAEIDLVSLSVGGVGRKLTYAKETNTVDIMSLVNASDDVRWNAVNMWAEFRFTPSLVRFEDFARFSLQWLTGDCSVRNNWCEGADLNHSGSVNTFDLKLLADQWLCVRPADWPL
jgi:hypothetical protein